MTIAAIPTVYNGIQFRSRLEARWAVLFDALHWEWQYEPADFRGWIPDFALAGFSTNGQPRPIYVEVKPVAWRPEGVCRELDRSGCDQECLILGIGPIFRPGGAVLGWLRQTDDEVREWGEAPLGRWLGSESTRQNPDRVVGFCHASQSFMDRITGAYDGGCYGAGTDPEATVRHAWSVATNTSQWKAPA